MPLANHGYPSTYNLYEYKNKKYINTKKKVTVTNTKYHVCINNDMGPAFCKITSNEYDFMGITKYYVEVSNVTSQYNVNEAKYKDKQHKKMKIRVFHFVLSANCTNFGVRNKTYQLYNQQ